jgi:D-inositol-3-phosphate glycosyltransferase
MLGVDAQSRFVPPVSRVELAQWYRAADLVLMPSHSESFGLVALEAEACGTPVVAADVGGLPMAVGDSGLLVEGHDVGDWSDAAESLLVDPARREALGRRAVAHAGRFGWGVTTDHLLQVYAEARQVRTPTPLDPLAAVVAPPALIP